MTKIIMYSTGNCPFCKQAEKLLIEKGLAFETIRVDHDPELRAEMMRITGRRTVPQIIINEKPIGGFDDLHALEQSGELDKMIHAKPDDASK